jgi:hypothetical protein
MLPHAAGNTGTNTRNTRTAHGNRNNNPRTQKQYFKSTRRKPTGKTQTHWHTSTRTGKRGTPTKEEKDILSRVYGDYNKTGIGLTTGLIGSHTVTVYTLYNSQQLSLFSSTEDFGSSSATTAATNSYGVPCHYSLTGAAPLSNTELTISFGGRQRPAI